MRDYKINIKLTLKTDLLQSGKNKKEIEEKIKKVIMDSISNNKVLSSLFSDKNKYSLKLTFTKYDKKN